MAFLGDMMKAAGAMRKKAQRDMVRREAERADPRQKRRRLGAKRANAAPTAKSQTANPMAGTGVGQALGNRVSRNQAALAKAKKARRALSR